MPDPKDFKDEKSFMAECMHQTLKVEGKPQAQATAMCLNMWRNRNKKKKKKNASEFIRNIANRLLDGRQKEE